MVGFVLANMILLLLLFILRLLDLSSFSIPLLFLSSHHDQMISSLPSLSTFLSVPFPLFLLSLVHCFFMTLFPFFWMCSEQRKNSNIIRKSKPLDMVDECLAPTLLDGVEFDDFTPFQPLLLSSHLTICLLFLIAPG